MTAYQPYRQGARDQTMALQAMLQGRGQYQANPMDAQRGLSKTPDHSLMALLLRWQAGLR